METQSSSSMKPYQLKQHLITVHPEHFKRDQAFFEVKETRLKKIKLYSSRAFHQQAKSIVHASMGVALLVAETRSLIQSARLSKSPVFLNVAKMPLTNWIEYPCQITQSSQGLLICLTI